MFKKSSTHSHRGDYTFIAAECQITGSITINGNARFDGKLEGNILATGNLIVGPSANLIADIEANTVSIAGDVHGNIKTAELLELHATARLFGDICTREFMVEQGARFIGSSQILEETAPLIVHGFKENLAGSKELNSIMDTKLTGTHD